MFLTIFILDCFPMVLLCWKTKSECPALRYSQTIFLFSSSSLLANAPGVHHAAKYKRMAPNTNATNSFQIIIILSELISFLANYSHLSCYNHCFSKIFANTTPSSNLKNKINFKADSEPLRYVQYVLVVCYHCVLKRT